MEFEKNTYTINEVSEMLDINTSTLRSWEQEFHLKIPRNNRNHRYYKKKEVDVFKIIKQGRDQNLGIDIIKKQLEKHGIIEDQQEHGKDLMTIDQLTVQELQDVMAKKFKDVVTELVIERENELKKDFEDKLIEREEAIIEKLTLKIREQIQSENQKLMEHIAITRNKEKQSFLSRIFKKRE